MTQVFNLLAGHQDSCRGTRSLTLLGHPTCNRGFQKLLGVGLARFQRLSQAVKQGAPVAPLDMRYVPKDSSKQSHKRSLVFDFLHNLYLTAGESLPDCAHSSSNKRPRQGPYKFDAPSVDKTKLRHLPPGKFADYHRLCTSEHPGECISKKLFTSVWNPV